MTNDLKTMRIVFDKLSFLGANPRLNKHDEKRKDEYVSYERLINLIGSYR